MRDRGRRDGQVEDAVAARAELVIEGSETVGEPRLVLAPPRGPRRPGRSAGRGRGHQGGRGPGDFRGLYVGRLMLSLVIPVYRNEGSIPDLLAWWKTERRAMAMFVTRLIRRETNRF